MKKNSLSPLIVTGILLAVFFGIALYLRVGFIHDQVFVSGQVRFTETDAYYHMRLVDNMSHHLPWHITFDPYTHYPYGTRVPWPPFFDWMIVGIAWVIGLGSPSQHMFEVVGAWLAPLLGAATVIPVYFIGKELFNRLVGILSAALIAILPGEFLSYSVLGCCDHHVAEVLFATLTMLFLLLGVKSARQRQLTFSVFSRHSWISANRPLLYSLLAGLVFGIYLLTWVGGLLLIFIIFTYFVVQSIVDHLKGESSDYLLIVALPMVLFGGAISLPWVTSVWTGQWFVLSLPIVVLTPIILVILSRFWTRKGLRPIYYPLVVLGLGVTGLAVLWAISPSTFDSLSWAFSYVLPFRGALDIWEAQPLLFPLGEFSLSYAWSRFNTAFFLSLVAIVILGYSVVRRGNSGKTLFLVWSLLMLFAVLGQVRFSYYFAVNAALLTGYLSWQALHFSGFGQTDIKAPKIPKKLSKASTSAGRTQRSVPHTAPRWQKMALGAVIVFSLVFIPSASQIPANASRPHFFPDDAWLESLSWLKDNTPDPFGNPDFYYELYESPPRGEVYEYPESAYGIMAWWHYGHWITRIARRIPVSNPFQQGAAKAAQFFTAQDEASAEAVVDELGVRYVIIDKRLATGFYGTATWVGLSERDFYDLYYQPQMGRLVPIVLYHPEYYRSLCVRLYNFEGKEVIPDQCTLISYEERVVPTGKKYKEITGSQTFNTYEEAEVYMSNRTSGNHKIVSSNPFVSPVPLEELKYYRLVFSSEAGNVQAGVGMVPTVKIFEYEK